MKVSDYIVKFFEDKEVEYIFGYLGGMITHLADSISKSNKIKYIQTYHEQSSALVAEGYSRESKKIGVAISTSGPGVTNMITGIANAYFDSVPMIYITGQVNTYDYKYDKPIRQLGFQEMNVIKLTESITKYSKLIDKVEDIEKELNKAYIIATTGRMGPVVLDIPMNIQRADIVIKENKENDERKEIKEIVYDTKKLKQSLELIKNSKAPMFLIGGGFNLEDSKELFETIVAKTGIPVVNSLLGKGGISENREEHMGFVGSYGNRCANISIFSSDCLIVLGSRLDTRQVGNFTEKFEENKKIIHIDIDEEELNHNRLKNKLNIRINSKKYLEYLQKNLFNYKISNEWKKYLINLKNKYSQGKEIENNIKNDFPYRIMEMLSSYSSRNEIFVADIGQNQMWAAQHLKIKSNQKWFTSGGLAPMGYSIPASIGASFASRNKQIFAIVGDGGFQMSLQSLMLISQYNLKIKIIVLNNESLGMITQFQELYFNSRMVGTTKKGGYFVPNIKDISNAYGLKYFKITKDDLDNKKLLNSIFENKNCIIEFLIEGETKVYPKLEFDSSIENVSPKLSKNILEKEIFKI